MRVVALGPIHGYAIAQRIQQMSREALAGPTGVPLSRSPSPRIQKAARLQLAAVRDRPRSQVLRTHRQRPSASQDRDRELESASPTWSGSFSREPWRESHELAAETIRTQALGDRDLDKELRFHFESQVADKVRSGIPENEARRLTRLEFGGMRTDQRGLPAEPRHNCGSNRSCRTSATVCASFANRPASPLIAILSLTLGIGANTAIFTLLNAILLRPLPVQNPGELLLFGDGQAQGSTESVPDGNTKLFSYSFFHDFRQKDTSFSGIAAVDSTQFETKASIAGAAYQTTHVNLVSGSYFSVLRRAGISGPDDWRIRRQRRGRRSGRRSQLLLVPAPFQRRPIRAWERSSASSRTTTRWSALPSPDSTAYTVGQSTDLWIPLSMEKAFSRPGWNGLGDKLFQSLYLIGRLKPGVTAAQASAETNLLFKQIVRSYLGPQPPQKHLDDLAHASIQLTPGGRGVSPLRYAFSVPLEILMAIVALVLLIACANIANMLLARGVARTREVAVRMALGASRRRIVFQLLTESALLAFLGAAAGVALAWKASALLLNMATPGPDPVPLNLDPRHARARVYARRHSS